MFYKDWHEVPMVKFIRDLFIDGRIDTDSCAFAVVVIALQCLNSAEINESDFCSCVDEMEIFLTGNHDWVELRKQSDEELYNVDIPF